MKSIGDSFFSIPSDGGVAPVENSLALTRAFIYTKESAKKKINIGTFEMDVLWIYILIAVIVITAVVVGIICCCSGGDKKEDMMEKMDDEEKKSMMEGEEPKEDAPMDPPAEM